MYRSKISFVSASRVDTENVVAINQSPALPFNIGINGFPKSDVEVILDSNPNELSALINRKALGSTTTNDNLTEEQRLATLKSRRLQTPSELASFERIIDGVVSNASLFPSGAPAVEAAASSSESVSESVSESGS